jgi:hypothetical protein
LTTARTPIRKGSRFKITDEAIAIFRRMGQLPDCVCDDSSCGSCEDYRHLHGQLCAVLKLPPHCWPAIAHPDEDCPFMPGTGGFVWWPEAQSLWLMLNRLAFPPEENAA